MQWINSAGGPLILISEKSYKKWSGTFSRELYLQNEFIEAKNLLSPEESDYGKACSIPDFIGTVDLIGETAIILGDEPLSTTVFESLGSNLIVIARCYYTNDEQLDEKKLKSIDLNTVGDWTLDHRVTIHSEAHLLFDSAFSGYLVDYDNIEHMLVSLAKGDCAIWSAEYSPSEESKYLLHKFEVTS
jgi:hypothetical protein